MTTTGKNRIMLYGPKDGGEALAISNEFTVIRRCHRDARGPSNRRAGSDPVVTVRENFVACEMLSQLQRVIDNPRFLLTAECGPLSAGRRVRIYASRGQ